MAELTKGRKVLVKRLSLSFGDYKNIAGEIIEVHDEYASVVVPQNKISVEDLRDLKKVGDAGAIVSVKLTSLAKKG